MIDFQENRSLSSEGCEECVPQHRIVFGRLVIPMKPQKKKIVKFVPKSRVWKLKDEETARLFIHEMAAINGDVTKGDPEQAVTDEGDLAQSIFVDVWNDERSTLTQGDLVVE